MIYDGDKYEVLTFDEPYRWSNEREYRTGPIHNKCRLPALKRFNRLLIKDIDTMVWFTEQLMVACDNNATKNGTQKGQNGSGRCSRKVWRNNRQTL
jgi:hypothetical protein